MNTRRCAIYTRKSTDEGLEQDFNSLEAQREACKAFITSQRHEGWEALPEAYDDGGYSGGTLTRPALQNLLNDCKAGRIDTIVVYKIDRLTRSLADFAKMVELFDTHKVNFVSVTQQFNTTTSMGRLTLNVLLSFAQFEREVTGERIRDKIAASKAKGMWMGGHVPLGYEKNGRTLAINSMEANQIQHIFTRYIALGSIMQLRDELFRDGYRAKPRRGDSPGNPFSVGQLTALLTNPIYMGQIRHKGQLHPGNHPAIVDAISWQQVQALRATAQETYKHRTHAKNPSLLAGVLFDAEGHPMSPSHSNKQGKRYRYYVSQAIIQGKSLQPSTLAKIPAGELESCISHAIQAFLKDDIQIRAAIPTISPSQRCLARQVAATWDHQRAHLVLRKLLARVNLHDDHIGLSIYLSSILKILNQNSESELIFQIKIPIKLKKVQGGATYLISNNPTPRTPNPVLILAIAKATRWNQLIITGQAPSLEKLAQQDNVRSSHIRTLIPLAWLAPDIVEVILKGEEPVGLTLGQLNTLKTADWPTQRHQLGFAA